MSRARAICSRTRCKIRCASGHAVGGMDFENGPTPAGVGLRAGVRALLHVLLGSFFGHQ